MSDEEITLVQRLRRLGRDNDNDYDIEVCDRAANRIEELEAERDKLKAALKSHVESPSHAQ